MVKAAKKPGRGPAARSRAAATAAALVARRRRRRRAEVDAAQHLEGVINFTLVSDGLFIEHKWGANSGNIGVPSASLVTFAQTVMKMAGANKASAAGGGKKGQSATAGKGKGIAKKKKPAKKPAAKKDTRGLEDLDAEMASYQAERSGPAAPAAEPAAAAVEGA